jgi:hypothetical protein
LGCYNWVGGNVYKRIVFYQVEEIWMNKKTKNIVIVISVVAIVLIIVIGGLFLLGILFEKSQGFDSRLNGYWYSDEGEIFYFMAFSPSSFGHGVLGEGVTDHGGYQIENDKLVCNYRNEYTGNKTDKTFYYSLSDNDETLTLTEVDTGRIVVLKKEWETIDKDYSSLEFIKDDINKTLTVESCGENLIWG